MGLTIPCDKCKHENELGRVFCARCGIRLDSSRITANALMQNARPKSLARIGKALGVMVLLAVVSLVVLVFWPPPIEADRGTKSNGRALQKQLMAFQEGLATANRLGTTFPEKAINGYFVTLNEKSGVEVLADLNANSFHCVAVRTFGPLVAGNFKTPTLSLAYSVRGEAKENRLVVTSAALGHIPLPGPLKTMAVTEITKHVLSGEKYEDLFKHVAELVIRNGAVEVAFGR